MKKLTKVLFFAMLACAVLVSAKAYSKAAVVAKDAVFGQETTTTPVSFQKDGDTIQVQVNHAGVLGIKQVISDSANWKLYRTVGTLTLEVDSDYASKNESGYLSVPGPGTYTLKYTNYGSYGCIAYLYCYSCEDRNLNSGAISCSFSGDNRTVAHKVVLNKSGYITLQGYSINISSSGNTMSSVTAVVHKGSKNTAGKSYSLSSYNSYTHVIALEKGTYYITVADSDPVYLKQTYKAVTDKAGKSKKKACTLKKKKTKDGLCTLTESANKAHWYKIKLKKKSKLKFTVKNYGTDGSLYFQVYPASKKVIIFGTWSYASPRTIKTWSTTKKVPKGTYYIKVYKSYSDYSMPYSICSNS